MSVDPKIVAARIAQGSARQRLGASFAELRARLDPRLLAAENAEAVGRRLYTTFASRPTRKGLAVGGIASVVAFAGFVVWSLRWKRGRMQPVAVSPVIAPNPEREDIP